MNYSDYQHWDSWKAKKKKKALLEQIMSPENTDQPILAVIMSSEITLSSGHFRVQLQTSAGS